MESPMDSEVEQDLVVPGTTADVEAEGQADEAQFLSGVSFPAAAVSLLAFAAAVLHVALPSLEIDTTTLALLGIAALPWLAPFLKSVTLPGGFELVLQDLQRQVRHVRTEVQDGNRRVDELAATIENLVFTGETVPPDEREGIAAALGGFRAFLTSAGLPVARTEPDVKFDHEATYPYYAPNDDGSAELVVSPGMPTEAI